MEAGHLGLVDRRLFGLARQLGLRGVDLFTNVLQRLVGIDAGLELNLYAGAALEGLGESDRAREIYERGVETAAKRGDLTTATKMQERLNALQR